MPFIPRGSVPDVVLVDKPKSLAVFPLFHPFFLAQIHLFFFVTTTFTLLLFILYIRVKCRCCM